MDFTTLFQLEQLFILKMVLATICGGSVGFERQVRNKTFGMRTAILICMGSMLFVHLGSQMSGVTVDNSRVLGQVVTGVGFLGAGAVISQNGFVYGFTSAAFVWLLAAIGCSIGLGEFGTAVVITYFSLAVLTLARHIESRFVLLQRESRKKLKRERKAEQKARLRNLRERKLQFEDSPKLGPDHIDKTAS